MVVMDWPKPFIEIGWPPITRRAESPRPIPQMVRGPNMSFIVANIEAMTVQSLWTGLVTIGPIMTLEVASNMAWEDHESVLPQHAGLERPHVGEPGFLGGSRLVYDVARGWVCLQYEAYVH